MASTEELEAIMAEHADYGYEVCLICTGVRWPCGPWVDAREAWDAAETE